ncbi:MAG: glycosyltransferase family 9 protein [Deltaproteobacteria bacterium]|nr:glycosyltransferase family 9 protein [Deltaproteobacteria bacterium]
MWLLNLFFSRKEEKILEFFNVRRILVIRTDERLGEIIITLPLINHLRRVYDNAIITFLMCERYAELSKYIECDEFLFFEKRRLASIVELISNLRKVNYDLVVLGGKIYPPSLTSYIFAALARGRYKIAIRQRGFNPFINVPIDIKSISEPLSKYELARTITKKELPFDNSLKFDLNLEKTYDVMVFIDARKVDHLIPIDTIVDIMEKIFSLGYRVIVVSGKGSQARADILSKTLRRRFPSIIVEFSLAPSLDVLMKIIRKSKSVIVANTGVMHLSVALGVPTCGLFINASPVVWGYQFSPHLMVDCRGKEININEIVNFIKFSIRSDKEGLEDVLS